MTRPPDAGDAALATASKEECHTHIYTSVDTKKDSADFLKKTDWKWCKKTQLAEYTGGRLDSFLTCEANERWKGRRRVVTSAK